MLIDDKLQNLSQLEKKTIEYLNTAKTGIVKTISKITQSVINFDQKIEDDTIIKGKIAQKMDNHLELLHDLFNFSGTVLVKKEGETILEKVTVQLIRRNLTPIQFFKLPQ